MGPVAVPLVSLLRSLKGFGRDTSGAHAVEFGFVAVMFFPLVLAIVETATVSGAGLLLDVAVDNAARQVMTGEVLEKDLDQAAFRKSICDQVSFMLTCSKLKIDLRTFKTTAEIPTSVVKKLGSVDDSKFCYDPGAQQSITVLRAFYEWPWVANFLQKLASDSNGNVILFSMAAFMNEPYGSKSSTHATCA